MTSGTLEGFWGIPHFSCRTGSRLKRFAVELPLRHEAVHQRDEPRVVRRLQQGIILMQHDIFEDIPSVFSRAPF